MGLFSTNLSESGDYNKYTGGYTPHGIDMPSVVAGDEAVTDRVLQAIIRKIQSLNAEDQTGERVKQYIKYHNSEAKCFSVEGFPGKYFYFYKVKHGGKTYTIEVRSTTKSRK